MYSTVAALRENIERMGAVDFAATFTAAYCESIIARADRWVRMHVQPLLVETIPDTDPPTCDEIITELAENAACHLALIRMFSNARTPRNNEDIQGWKDDRDELLASIETRQVDLDYATTLGTNWREDGRKPAFGQGKYGEYDTDNEPGTEDDEYEIREDT